MSDCAVCRKDGLYTLACGFSMGYGEVAGITRRMPCTWLLLDLAVGTEWANFCLGYMTLKLKQSPYGASLPTGKAVWVLNGCSLANSADHCTFITL